MCHPAGLQGPDSTAGNPMTSSHMDALCYNTAFMLKNGCTHNHISTVCMCVCRIMSAARHILYSTWSKMTAPLAVTVRYYITQIWRLGLLCRSADSDPVHVCMCVSLPTVLVLTLLVFREASGCHRSLGAQRRAGKTHVKIYSHWVWLQASHWAAIWQMTFNRSSYSFCILMSEEKSEGGMGRL